MRHSSLAIALSLLVLPAAAQAVVTVKVNNATTTLNFGRATCKAATTASFSWDVGQGFDPATQTITLRASGKSDCSANTTDKTYPLPTNPQTGQLTVALSDFLFELSGGCDADVPSSAAKTAWFCVTLAGTGTGSTPVTGSATVSYALTPPTAPASVSAQGGNNLIRVSWAIGNSAEKIANYDVYVVEAGGAVTDSTPAVAKAVAATSATVEATSSGGGLLNDVPYDVVVRARDTFDNVSALSAAATATPVAVDDFYNYYRRSGGQAEGGGGCTSLPFGPLSLVGLFALGRRARTRRAAGRSSRRRLRGPFLIGAALALGLFFTALPAFAQAMPVRSSRPPRRLLFALKFDKYDPQIDSEAALKGKTPYADIFAGRVPFRAQLESDFAVAHFYGSFLVGVTAGFWQNIGKGREVVSGNPSGDTALLNLWPFGLVATYRFDWLADEVHWFPLIPYAQVGLAASLWVSKGGNGSVSDSTVSGAPGHGSGWTTGYTTALGLALSIDSLSPGLANEAYIDMGLQRTSVFAEYGWTRLDGFRNQSSLILSDKGLRFGLGLEF